jgi:hypothetical protein
MADPTGPYPTMTETALANLANSNSDPLKNWADSIGMVNSPQAGTGAQSPIQ